MACQSLDQDEILNVRWATEDPNPTSKVAERERLEELGQKAIQERMDPEIIEAMRAVRALEDGEPLPDEEQDDGLTTEELELLENGGHDEDRAPKRRRLEAPPPSQDKPKGIGLLSADTLEGLNYFAEIRKRQSAAVPAVKVAAVPSKAPTGINLADYGSDDE